MKRCPECRRDYYDETLSFCLDDGTALLEGPASMDEPATAILSDPAAKGSSPLRLRDSELKTAVFQPADKEGASDLQATRRTFDRRLLVAPLLMALIGIGSFVGYRYFVSDTGQIESMAVMPFVNGSGNPEFEYLSDGMTETLISKLSKVPNLTVKARGSVFRYKGLDADTRTVGSDLGVQALLNGRVVQRGEQLSMTVELIDVKSENILWSEQYLRRTSDLLALQSEIARDVSSQLHARLTGADEHNLARNYTASPAAHELYLKGRFHWNRRTVQDVTRSLGYFQQAVDIDP